MKNSHPTRTNRRQLLTAVGTLPLRARRGMITRKLGKTHQNVLVFYKGDPSTIGDHHPRLDRDMYGDDGGDDADA